MRGGRERWHARIAMNGVKVHLGLFDTRAEARAAYLGAAAVIHREFQRSDHGAGKHSIDGHHSWRESL
jgi:hypothetical protein